jgi:hypothetical protein
MSQYLVIFLLVAVFRGVVWVVQKVQQNAKAREALMAQQAQAQVGDASPGGVTQRDERARVSVSPETARPKVDVARRGASRVSSREGRSPQRVQSRGRMGGPVARPSREAAQPPAPEVRVSTASRADQREARVDQSSRDIRSMLRDPTTLRRIVLAREILGSPRGLRA